MKLLNYFSVYQFPRACRMWADVTSVQKSERDVTAAAYLFFLNSDSDSKHALAQLKAEQTTVGDPKCSAGCFGKVAG